MHARLYVYLFCALFLVSCSDNSHRTPSVPQPKDKHISEVPNVKTDADVKQKKQRFFDFLLPLIIFENTKIYNERQIVIFSKNQFSNQEALSRHQTKALRKLALKYKVDEELYSKEYRQPLRRCVDVLPPLLALTPAALESHGVALALQSKITYLDSGAFLPRAAA